MHFMHMPLRGSKTGRTAPYWVSLCLTHKNTIRHYSSEETIIPERKHYDYYAGCFLRGIIVSWEETLWLLCRLFPGRNNCFLTGIIVTIITKALLYWNIKENHIHYPQSRLDWVYRALAWVSPPQVYASYEREILKIECPNTVLF